MLCQAATGSWGRRYRDTEKGWTHFAREAWVAVGWPYEGYERQREYSILHLVYIIFDVFVAWFQMNGANMWKQQQISSHFRSLHPGGPV